MHPGPLGKWEQVRSQEIKAVFHSMVYISWDIIVTLYYSYVFRHTINPPESHLWHIFQHPLLWIQTHNIFFNFKHLRRCLIRFAFRYDRGTDKNNVCCRDLKVWLNMFISKAPQKHFTTSMFVCLSGGITLFSLCLLSFANLLQRVNTFIL